mgnify:CR=1 FL=1
MLKRGNIANLLNQQILLEELEKKEGKKVEKEIKEKIEKNRRI